jgi:putative ABC transport system substrate-binding protein
VIEYRQAEDQIERLPALAADLVRRQGSLIIAAGSRASPLAANSAIPSIPIVFDNTADPVQLGLVASLNRPGGNLTGVTTVSSELEAKRLGLPRELVPSATSIAVLVNSSINCIALHGKVAGGADRSFAAKWRVSGGQKGA